MAIVVTQKVNWLSEEVCDLLATREAAQHFARWCDAVALVAPRLPPETRDRLRSFIENLTVDELSFGHITNPDGTKAIQVAFQARALCGWRELAALLALAPAAPRTLELMSLAMARHPRALVPAFRAVLARFAPADALAWIVTLLKGGQQRRCVAVDLLEGLAVAIGPAARAIVAELAADTQAPAIVRERAARAVDAMEGRPRTSSTASESERVAVTVSGEWQAVEGGRGRRKASGASEDDKCVGGARYRELEMWIRDVEREESDGIVGGSADVGRTPAVGVRAAGMNRTSLAAPKIVRPIWGHARNCHRLGGL
jgi:hypothetical protein